MRASRQMLAAALLVAVMAAHAPAQSRKPAAASGEKAAKANAEGSEPAGFESFSFTSKKNPIQVTADKLDFDYKGKRTVFRGNVEVVQGDVHLTSDVFTVDYAQMGDKQDLRSVTADGNVKIVQGKRKAVGDHAVFDQASRTLVLTGRPSLDDGLNEVKGDKIIVYPDESRMEVSGDNSRVKVVIFPGQGSLGDDSPKPEATKPSGPAAGEKTASSDGSANP